MKFLTAIITLILLSPTPILSQCVVPTGTGYWYTLTTDQTSVFKDSAKEDSGAQPFCPSARKCYGGQNDRIYRLDFDGDNVQCVLFNQAGCVGNLKRTLTKSDAGLAGTAFLWTEWRSFFCWDVRLGILRDE